MKIISLPVLQDNYIHIICNELEKYASLRQSNFYAKSIFLLCLSAQSLAASFEPPTIDLIYTNENIPIPALPENRIMDVWMHSCKILASKFIEGRGMYSVGVFKAANCFTKENEYGDAWTLALKQLKDQIQIELTDPDGTSITKFILPTAEFGPLLLKNPEISDLISLQVHDSLPMAGVISTEFITAGNKLSIKIPIANTLTKHPYSEIKIFSIPKKTEDLVITKLVASGKIIEQLPNTAMYQLTEEDENEIPLGKHYFQHNNGPFTNTAEINSEISRSSKEFSEKLRAGYFKRFTKGLWNTTYRGFLGSNVSLYFSKQMFPTDEPIKNTYMFSLVSTTEYAGLGGIRYSFDMVPTQESSEAASDGTKTSINWSRHLLGAVWSWYLDSLADQFELSPKLGLWAAKGRYSNSQTTQNLETSTTSTASYGISNAYALAVESSLKWKMPHSQIKISHEFATSVGLSAKTSATSINSNEIGIELLLLTGPELIMFQSNAKLAVSLFSKVHILSITGGETGTEQQANGTTLTGGYTGVGTSLSW